MPDRPLTVRGSLKTRRPRGFVHEEMRFEMRVDFSRVPFRAVYKIFTSEGDLLYTLRLTRNGKPVLAFDVGDAATPASTPSLDAHIGQTDITWRDLTLDVLWWEAIRLEGRERMRGRDCDIVLARPPEARDEGGGARLWIDREIGMFLKVEHLDETGETTRSLWIRGVQKIDDRWFVKDLEVDSANSGTRTRLRVEDVRIEP